MFKVHVFDNFFRTNDFNDLETMVLFFFTFKYCSCSIDSFSIDAFKIFFDSLFIQLIPYLVFSLKKNIVLCPFSIANIAMVDIIFSIIRFLFFINFVIAQA